MNRPGLQGLVPFAQSNDESTLLNNTIISSETLGYVSNIMKMFSGSDSISYATVARNFHGASESLVKDQQDPRGQNGWTASHPQTRDSPC